MMNSLDLGQMRAPTVLPRLKQAPTLHILCFCPPSEMTTLLPLMCPPQGESWHFESIHDLEAGLDLLQDRPFDVLLLRLEHCHLELLAQLHRLAPQTAIIVITRHDELLGAQALQHGAQDYLCLGNFDAETLQKSILASHERHKTSSSTEFHDALTGLGRRDSFLLLLEQAHRRQRRFQDSLYGVLSVQMEDFAALKQRHGGLFCELIVMELALRLNQSLGEAEHLAYLEAGQFALFFDHLESLMLLPLIYRVQELLQRPVSINGQEWRLNFSLGAALSQPQCHAAVDILTHAEQAMLCARGRGHFVLYHEQLAEPELPLQFRCNYRPVVHLNDQSVVGFEVDLAWTRAQGFPVSLDEILFEQAQNQAVESIYAEALKKIAAQIQSCVLQAPDISALKWYFKLSRLQLRSCHYLEQFVQFLDDLRDISAMDAERFVLMIPESELLRPLEPAQRELLNELQMEGYALCLDEFTGGLHSLQAAGMLNFLWARIDYRALKQHLQSSVQVPVFEVLHPLLSLCHNLKLNPLIQNLSSPGEKKLLPHLPTLHGQGAAFGAAIPGSELAHIFA